MMSYSITLREPEYWYAVEEFNATYNYYPCYEKVWGDGLGILHNKSGAESIPLLEKAIHELGVDTDPDYWKPTEGNARQPLLAMLEAARKYPNYVWKVA
jgi:hypothetical protein